MLAETKSKNRRREHTWAWTVADGYRISLNGFLPWILSSFEQFPHQKWPPKNLCTFPKSSRSSWVVICVLLCSAWVWINLEGPPRPLTFSVQAVIFLVLFCEHHDVGVWISSLRTFATSSMIKFFLHFSALKTSAESSAISKALLYQISFLVLSSRQQFCPANMED